jgi:hypothetical protein
MPFRSDTRPELTPQALEVLRVFEKDAEALREIDLTAAPAPVFQAD